MKYLLKIFVLFLLFSMHSALGQTVDKNDVKAAYIINFIKHINWNQENDTKYFRIAVFSDTAMYRVLKNAAENKIIREKPIIVSYISNRLNLTNFQIIVVSEDNNMLLGDIYKKYSRNRLIITENAGLKNSMINFNTKEEKLNFEMNDLNITNAGLQPSEYLKGVFISDVDILRNKIIETDKKVELAKESIKNQAEIIEEQKKQVKRKIDELAELMSHLNQLKNDDDLLKENIERQKTNLLKLQSELEKKEIAIKEKEINYNKLLIDHDKRQVLNEKQIDEIQTQDKKIQENIKFLKDLETQIKVQKDTISKREAVVQKQRSTIIIIVGILLLLITVAGFIYRNNRIKHLANIELEQKNKKIQKQAMELEIKSEKLTKAILELKMTQNHLINSEKMASLGNMVAGVAHEINTPVGVGITAMSHLHLKYKEFMDLFLSGRLKKSDLTKFLDLVGETTEITENNLRRAGILVQNFKQVSVDQSTEEMREIFIEQYIKGVLLSFFYEFKHTQIEVNITCEKDFQINTYPGAISQIVTNLLMNAKIHAFDKNQDGKIEIIIDKRTNDYVISVADNGKGIPEANMKVIFDPFFTTKRNEGGSGLGLSIVHNLVNNKLKGDIAVESAKEKGTKFTITLPLNIN